MPKDQPYKDESSKLLKGAREEKRTEQAKQIKVK